MSSLMNDMFCGTVRLVPVMIFCEPIKFLK